MKYVLFVIATGCCFCCFIVASNAEENQRSMKINVTANGNTTVFELGHTISGKTYIKEMSGTIQIEKGRVP